MHCPKEVFKNDYVPLTSRENIITKSPFAIFSELWDQFLSKKCAYTKFLSKVIICQKNNVPHIGISCLTYGAELSRSRLIACFCSCKMRQICPSTYNLTVHDCSFGLSSGSLSLAFVTKMSFLCLRNHWIKLTPKWINANGEQMRN